MSEIKEKENEKITINPGDYIEYWESETEYKQYLTGESKVITTISIRRLLVENVNEYKRILLKDKNKLIQAEYGQCKFLIKNAFSHEEKNYPMSNVDFI